MAFILHMNQLFSNEVEFAKTIPQGKIKSDNKKFLNTPKILFDLIRLILNIQLRINIKTCFHLFLTI